MKKKIALLIAGFLILSVFAAPVRAQSPAQIAAMKKRAEKIIKMKNNFVKRVLKSYSIPYRVTPNGTVAEIKMQNDWMPVKRIDIVPVAEETDLSLTVKGHEIYFYTQNQIVHLVSSLVIR